MAAVVLTKTCPPRARNRLVTFAVIDTKESPVRTEQSSSRIVQTGKRQKWPSSLSSPLLLPSSRVILIFCCLSKNGRCSNNYASLRRPYLLSSSNCLRTANELGRGETVETRGHIALRDLQAGYSQCAEILTDSGNESEAAGMEKFITLPPRCTMCPKVQRSVRQPILYPPCRVPLPVVPFSVSNGPCVRLLLQADPAISSN